MKKINKKDVEEALNECFGHNIIYNGYIQIFPNAIYKIEGRKIAELYKKLKLENKKREVIKK